MKKHILLMSALFFCGMTAFAQQPLYKMKITLQDGSKLAALTDEIDSMQLTEVGMAEAEVTERYKTSSSLAVNIDAEASVTRIQAAILPGSELEPDVDYTEYVQKHSVCDAKGSCTVAFDFLQPESIYTIFVLAYDENGLPTGLKSLVTTTGAVADDPFTVRATDIGNTTVAYSIAPKDPSMKYYSIATGYDYYKLWQQDGDANGDVLKHFINMWATFASWYGDTWQSIMKMDLKTAETTNDASHLMWDARQVVISFGMDEEGNLTSPIQIDTLHTTKPTPSSMEIPVTVVTNEWNNVQIKAEPTTDEPYFIVVQPAEYVDRYDSDEALLRALCYEADNINPATLARTRDTDIYDGLWEFRVRKEVDTDYYVIAIGLDGGAPATRPFKTKITVPGQSF